MFKQMKLKEQQWYAMSFPMDDKAREEKRVGHNKQPLTGDLTIGHHREIGRFTLLLTVDMYKREDLIIEDDLTRPEWHASVGYFERKMSTGERVLLAFSAWPDKAKEEAIRICKTMIKGRGQGVDLWLGKPASLHLFRPLEDNELSLLPYLPTYLTDDDEETPDLSPNTNKMSDDEPQEIPAEN